MTTPRPALSDLREYLAYYKKHWPDGTSLIRDSRKMIDALDPLISHCPRLNSLRIVILGPCEELRPVSREEGLYRLCARFINAERGTLRTLDFEQGYSCDEQAAWDSPYNYRGKIFPRPMDRMFAEHVLPILMDAPWPCVENIGLRDVGKLFRQLTRTYPPPAKSFDDVEYLNIDPSKKGSEDARTWNIVLKSFPSVEQMQFSLQDIIL
jgi:hypothetical protein